jgi:hypothetical protein
MLQWKARNNIEACKEARREARKLYRRKKKRCEEEVLEELQEKYKINALNNFMRVCIRSGEASNQESQCVEINRGL